MISITHAILHSMDVERQQYFLSGEELVLDVAICEYLIRHIEKTKAVNDAQKGTFKITSKLYSEVKAYDESQFVSFSKTIANQWFGAYVEANKYLDMNLLFVQYIDDDIPYFIAMQFKNKKGYIRSIQKESMTIKNEIITHSALLPSLSQSVEEFFVIQLQDYSILLKENKSYINHDDEFVISDQILYCDIEMSVKDSIKTLHRIVARVSDELDEDELENTLKLKRFVKSCVDVDNKIDVEALCPNVFPQNPSFEEKFSTLALENHLPKEITMSKKTPMGIKKHKIKTDIGIEISIPVEFADSKDVFQMIENSDGTVTITLDHVGKVIE